MRPWSCALLLASALASSAQLHAQADSLQAALRTWATDPTAILQLRLDPALPPGTTPGRWDDELRTAQRDVARRLGIHVDPLPPVLLAASRTRVQALAGVAANGLTVFDGPALVFVYSDPPNRLAVRHELGHWMPAMAWQGPWPAAWIAEGLATWAQELCSGASIRAAAATLAATSRLPDLAHLSQDFRDLPELPAYLAAGSFVAYLESRDPSVLRVLWRHGLSEAAARLETDLPRLEAGWRQWLTLVPAPERPPWADLAAGCQQ